jgi:hypothetical protein
MPRCSYALKTCNRGVAAVVGFPHAPIIAHRTGGNAVLSQTTPPGPFPIQHAFVVQFAAETTLDVTGITGRVEHLVSGQATRFRSLEALFAFMTARLQEVQQTSTAENPATDV